MLPENKRTQLDGIVQQMVANNESDSNIRFVVDDFKTKYTVEETPKVATKDSAIKQLSQGVGKGILTTGKNVVTTLGAAPLRFIEKGVDKAMGREGQKSDIPDVFTPGTETEQKVSEALKPETPLENIGMGAEQFAEFVIPGGAIAKTTKGTTAATRIGGQVLSDVAVSSAQQGDLKDAGTQALISGALSSIPFLGSVIGPKIAPKIKGLSTKLEEINLRLRPSDKLALQKTQPNLTEYLASRKITGTPEERLVKLDKLYDSFESLIQKKLTGAGDAAKRLKYSKQELVSAVRKIPDEYLNQVENPEVYEKLQSYTKSLEGFIKKQKGDFIDATRVNQFKRQFAKNARNKAGDTVTNEAREAISDGLYTLLLKDSPGLKELNKEYSKIILSRKLLGKALGKNELGLVGNIISLAAGSGIGSAVGGAIGAAGGAVAGPIVGKKVFGTKTRSIIGSKLQDFSNYLKKAKTDKAGNMLIPRSIINSMFSD